MGVNSLPTTVTRQRRDCDLNPGLLRLNSARQPVVTEPQNRYECPINVTTKAKEKRRARHHRAVFATLRDSGLKMQGRFARFGRAVYARMYSRKIRVVYGRRAGRQIELTAITRSSQ